VDEVDEGPVSPYLSEISWIVRSRSSRSDAAGLLCDFSGVSATSVSGFADFFFFFLDFDFLVEVTMEASGTTVSSSSDSSCWLSYILTCIVWDILPLQRDSTASQLLYRRPLR
jgi:hypothetical protein